MRLSDHEMCRRSRKKKNGNYCSLRYGHHGLHKAFIGDDTSGIIICQFDENEAEGWYNPKRNWSSERE